MGRVLDVGQDAVGVIAIGQFATGVIAIGQVATGVIAIGQVARGVIAIGMVAFGLFSVGMAALGVGWAGGMLALGGRVAGGVRLPLVPHRPRTVTPGWAALSTLQLAVLVFVAVMFWRFAAVPVGDALLGSGGMLRER